MKITFVQFNLLRIGTSYAYLISDVNEISNISHKIKIDYTIMFEPLRFRVHLAVGRTKVSA